MEILRHILDTLPDARVVDVRLGLHWTAVAVEKNGIFSCGLGSTLQNHSEEQGRPDVPLAGQLDNMSGLELANMVLSDQPPLASIGMAAVNALLPKSPQIWVDANAEAIIAQHGEHKNVVVVGHFPFVDRLRQQVGNLTVLEMVPRLGDVPAELAPQVLPQADVVAITAMTLINHTLPGLLSLCSKDALIIVLGPSSPLSPVLFDYGIALISGCVVTHIDPVLKTISQGGNFRQVHRAGVRLVNISKSMDLQSHVS